MRILDSNGLAADASFDRNLNHILRDRSLRKTWKKLAINSATIQEASRAQSNRCEICKTNYTNRQVLMRHEGCRHTFHAECFLSWLQHSCICPSCRDCLESRCEVQNGIFFWSRYLNYLLKDGHSTDRVPPLGHIQRPLGVTKWLSLQLKHDEFYLCKANPEAETWPSQEVLNEFHDNVVTARYPSTVIDDTNTELVELRASWLRSWNVFSLRFKDDENPPVIDLVSPNAVNVFRKVVELTYSELTNREFLVDRWFRWHLECMQNIPAELFFAEWLHPRRSSIEDWQDDLSNAYHGLRLTGNLWYKLQADENLPPEPLIISFDNLQAVINV